MEQKNIDRFFEEYEKHFNLGLSEKEDGVNEAVAVSFENCFIGSSPAGVECGKNDESFPANIKKGFEFYRNIGTQAMNILSKDITVLDEYHVMVKIRWHYSAFKQDSSMVMIDFDNIYFLRVADGQTKIFAYITGDEQKALKENGLLPEN